MSQILSLVAAAVALRAPVAPGALTADPSVAAASGLVAEARHAAYRTHNMLAALRAEANDLRRALVDTARLQNQLLYQCADPAAVAFADTGTDALEAFRIWDPLDAAKSKWIRDAHETLADRAPRPITQIMAWDAPDVRQATKLLLKNAQYNLGESLLVKVGLKPRLGSRVVGGVVLGYKDPSNFHFVGLAFEPGQDIALEFGQVEDGEVTSKLQRNCTAQGDVMNDYHVLAIESDPLVFHFAVDGALCGSLKQSLGTYDLGSAGMYDQAGSVSFETFTVGGGSRDSSLGLWTNERLMLKPEPVLVQAYEDLRKAKSDESGGTAGGKGPTPPPERHSECNVYKPTHVDKEADLACLVSSFWRVDNVPRTSLGGRGATAEDVSVITSVRDLRNDDEAQSCMVRDWSCADAEISVRMTLLSDGRAGLVWRAHNETLRTLLLVETISQRVEILEQTPAEGMRALQQLTSPVPILAHETNTLRLRDRNDRVSVWINDQPVLVDTQIPLPDLHDAAPTGWADAGRAALRAGAGFILTRGSAAFTDLAFTNF